MICKKIDDKYKKSFTTIILISCVSIILVAIQRSGITNSLGADYYLPLCLLGLSTCINSWILMRDPTFTCKRVSERCVDNVLIYNVINLFIQIPISYTLLMIFTNDTIKSIIITLVLFCVQGYFIWLKYKELDKPSVLKNTILNCQSIRVLFYSLILAFDLYFSYQFYSKRPHKEKLAEFFGIPEDFSIIMFMLFVFFGIIYPIVIDILALDGTLTYMKPTETQYTFDKTKYTEAEQALLSQKYEDLTPDQQIEFRKIIWFRGGKKWNDRRDDDSLLSELN